MAIYNLGRFLPVFKGNYSSTTSYLPLDIVYYLGSSYVAKQTTQGNAPTNTTYWLIVALKGELSPTLTPEQTASIIAQIESSANWVTDANYVHTDNNFTTAMQEAVNGIGDATITILKNGSSVGTFSTNASTNSTINITVPTTVEELSGGGEFIKRVEYVKYIATDIVLPYLEPNTVYYCATPIKSLTIQQPEIGDFQTSITNRPAYLYFETAANFVFQDVETLAWADAVPDFEEGSTYFIKYWGDFYELHTIIKNN